MSRTRSRTRVTAPRSGRGSIRSWYALALAFAVAGCEGDTLYDAPGGGVTGPVEDGKFAVALASHVVPERMEEGDAMTFDVRWSPRSGGPTTATLGVSARITGPGLANPVYLKLAEANVATGPAVAPLSVPYSQIRGALPAAVQRGVALSYEINAYALDQGGRCVAAVGEELQQLPCDIVGGVPTPMDTTGLLASVTGVYGTTAGLPEGVGEVGDLALHNGTGRLFVSNRTGHTLEVVELDGATPSFRSTGVPVGSQPWGLALSRDNSEVIVANSGGTNFSFVSVAGLQEERRLDIPRMTLHDLTLIPNHSTGTVECRLEWHNFTDRPQFVTQDLNGNLLYSAATSSAAPVGTIRRAWIPSSRNELTGEFLFPGAPKDTPVYPPLELRGVKFMALPDSVFGPLHYAVANLDSITIHTVNNPPFMWPTCQVTLHEHVPGSPDSRIDVTTPYLNLWDAFVELHSRGSDIAVVPNHAWNLDAAIETSDTTYVAASGDRNFVAFAPGAREPDARVTLWHSSELMSRFDDMHDLMNNTSDRIVGVDLNASGALGVIRGTSGAYFFDRDLRLKGTASDGLVDGIGAALLTHGGRTLAFLGTAQKTIRIVETDHYRSIAEIPVRDRVVGALRVGPGRVSGAGATVYAVTEGGVLVLSVPATEME